MSHSDTKESLILAALTTVVVGFTSLLAFNTASRTFLGPSIATIACSFPLGLTILHPGILLSEATKTIIGSMIGWILGATLYTVATLLTLHIGNKAIVATLLSFPFVFVLVLADPVCKSPLVPFISPSVSIIVMYVISSFAKQQALVTGGYMLVVYAVSCIASLLVFLSVGKGSSTKSNLDQSVRKYESTLTHWFEGLTGFMTSASGHHEADLDERQLRANEALNDLQSTMKIAFDQDPLAVFVDPVAAESISVTFVVLHSQLLALRGTIFHEGYTEKSLRTMLSPVRESLDRLRMSVRLALCPTTPSDIRTEALRRLCPEALLLYTDFVRSASASAARQILAESREEIRIVFAVTSIVRFAMLVEHLRSSVEVSVSVMPKFCSIKKYWKNQIWSLFQKSNWDKTTNFKYAFRSALAQQFVAQLLILLTKSYPTGVSPYIFWALVPVVSTFLPTVGAGLFVGSRNVLGCFVGAMLGVCTAIFTCGNREAIYLQMLIVCFTAKFASNTESLHVAALTLASTWNVLSIPNMHVQETSVLLTLVGYRISLTLLGVIASALFSLILFPSFAATVLRKSVARTLTTAASLVCEGIEGVVERLPVVRSASFDDECSVCSVSFAEGVTVSLFEGASNKALRTIRKHTAQIPTACEEAKPELVLVQYFRKKPEVATPTCSLCRLIKSEPLIQRLSDCACVFSSIAASTRLMENCHSVLFASKRSGFVKCLNHLVDILQGAAARIAASLMDPNACLQIDSKLSGYTYEVTRELISLRESLEKAGTLPLAERGGWLLIYVFHFALVEFTAAWDDLAEHLRNSHEIQQSPSGLLYMEEMEEKEVTCT